MSQGTPRKTAEEIAEDAYSQIRSWERERESRERDVKLIAMHCSCGAYWSIEDKAPGDLCSCPECCAERVVHLMGSSDITKAQQNPELAKPKSVLEDPEVLIDLQEWIYALTCAPRSGVRHILLDEHIAVEMRDWLRKLYEEVKG